MTKVPVASLSDPMAAVEAFRVALTKGDAGGVSDAHVEGDVAIIDNLSPFVWNGPTAVADWMLSMTVNVEERGIKDGSVVYDEPIAQTSDDDRAYVVVPAVWSYEAKGLPVRDIATIAFALRRTPLGWRIAAWSWNRGK